MFKRTETQPTKKANGHGDRSVTTSQSPRAPVQQKVLPGVTRKSTNPASATQEGAPKIKKVQSVIKQGIPQTPEKQEQKAVITNNTTASTSNNTAVAVPTPPRNTIEYKRLRVKDLKCGDLVLCLHHSVPDTTHLFHWLIYVHLGDGVDGQIIHATLFCPSGDPRGPDYWKFEAKAHTLYTPKLAYARLIGNISGLNASNFPNFERAVETEVPVPFIQRDESPNPKFTCRIWALSFIRFARKGGHATLPYTVGQLESEMKQKACSQAEKALAKCKPCMTPKGMICTFHGYKPLLEYVVITTIA